MMNQFEFTFIEESPVMAKVWVVEGRHVVTRMVPVGELDRLNGRVWGWSHLVKRGGK